MRCVGEGRCALACDAMRLLLVALVVASASLSGCHPTPKATCATPTSVAADDKAARDESQPPPKCGEQGTSGQGPDAGPSKEK
jgi:hypothetical protein